jgi:hypothetical protein
LDDYRSIIETSECVYCPPSTHSCALRGSSCCADFKSPVNHLHLRPLPFSEDVWKKSPQEASPPSPRSLLVGVSQRSDDYWSIIKTSKRVHYPPSTHSCALRGSTCCADFKSPVNHLHLRPLSSSHDVSLYPLKPGSMYILTRNPTLLDALSVLLWGTYLMLFLVLFVEVKFAV